MGLGRLELPTPRLSSVCSNQTELQARLLSTHNFASYNFIWLKLLFFTFALFISFFTSSGGEVKNRRKASLLTAAFILMG